MSATANLQLIDVRKDDRFTPPSPAALKRLWRGDGVLLQAGRCEFAVEILERKRDCFKGRVIESTPWLPAGTEITFHESKIVEAFVGSHD
jgi:hypothetical protein